MPNKCKFNVDDETIEILKQGTIKDNVYFLPSEQLERRVYEKVDQVLKALGAKWNRKVQGHLFEYDISEELKKVFEEKTVVNWKKATDFFYTPENVVNTMISLVVLWNSEKYKFLEPSCGQGHIVDKLYSEFKNSEITCIEKNRKHCEYMKNKGYNPICADFLEVNPEAIYDGIFMNPPFTQEYEHIKHAYEFLKEEGYLVTVASSNVLENTTKKAQDFKEWFKKRNGYCYKLPPDSFKETGTNVNTVLLIFERSQFTGKTI